MPRETRSKKKRQTTLSFATSSSAPRKQTAQKKQTRANRADTPPSTAALPISPPVVQATPARKTANFEIVIYTPKSSQQSQSQGTAKSVAGKLGSNGTSKKPLVVLGSSEDEEDVVASSTKKKRKRPTSTVLDESDSDLPTAKEVIMKGKEAVQKANVQKEVPPEEQEDNSNVPSTARKRRESVKKASKSLTYGEEEDGDESEVVVSVRRKRKGKAIRAESDEEDDTVTARRKRKGKQVAVDSDDEEEDATPITPSRKRKRKKATPKVNDLSDDDLEIVDEGGSQVLPGPSDRAATEEAIDLEEDVELAKKTLTLNSRTRYAGSSAKKPRTPQQRALEALKAKREGRQLIESDSDDERPKRALYDTDDDQDDDEEDEDDPGAESSTPESVRELFGDSESEHEWIIEDDEDATLGAPDGLNDIPIEFTRFSHMTPKENFKVFFQWLVQSILNPEFPHDDPFFKVTRKNLQTRTQTMGLSVLQSAGWTKEFTRAMQARPLFVSEECDPHQGCDACNRSTRIATFVVRFTGNRYNKETLEDITPDSDDSDSDDSMDSQGNEIAPETTQFYCGRSCHARAELAHSFYHWEKQLREQIEQELDAAGYINTETHELKEKWKKKTKDMNDEQRLAWANQVTEQLSHAVNELYADYNRGLKNAETNMNKQRTNQWR